MPLVMKISVEAGALAQPLVSVTVKLYVPEIPALAPFKTGLAANDWKPFGPVHS